MCDEQIRECKEGILLSISNITYKRKAANVVSNTPNVVTKSFVKCMEKDCSKEAVKDYNGHNHMVCQNCYECLNREFDEDYK